MAYPHQGAARTRLRAARSCGQPPTAFWGGDKEWGHRSYLAIEALQIYEDSVCGGCGQSALHSHDDKNAGRYDIKSVTCEGCAAIPEDPPTPAHGEQVYVVSLMSEDDTDREAYLYEEEGFAGSFAAPEDHEPIDGEDGI